MAFVYPTSMYLQEVLLVFVAKDMAQHDTLAILENRKRTSFHLDSSSFVRRSDDQSSLDSAASSPSSSSRSPTTPFAHPPNCAPSPESSMDRVREPALGPQRTRSVSSSSKGDKEKRKRSRVAPEQLIHLERFFAADRSPTAARRREISELLAMQERQTQIWFQNRSVNHWSVTTDD